MLIFLDRFGTTHKTDGMLGAYSVYVLVTVAAQGSRVSGSAALGGAKPRLSEAEFGWVLAITAVAVACGIAAAHGPLAILLSPDSAQAVSVARSALPVLGTGAALQIAAIGWATVLGQRGHLIRVGLALIVGAICGLIVFLLLLGPLREQALAWATVAAGGVSTAIMAARAPLHADAVRRSRLGRAARILASGNVMPLAPTLIYFTAMAVASRVTSRPGDITLFGLAFLASSYACGIVSVSGAIVDTVELSRTQADDLAWQLQSAVPDPVRASSRLVVAALLVAALVAPPTLSFVSPAQVQSANPEQMATYLVLFVPFSVGVAVMNAALPAWYTTGDARRLNRSLPGVLVLHVVISAVAGTAFGAAGVAAASAVAGLLLAWITLRPAPGLATAVAAAVLPGVWVCGAAFVAIRGLIVLL